MIRSMLVVAAISVGAWSTGTQAGTTRHSCCAPAADCCFEGAPCCDASACSALFADEKKPEAKETKLTGTLVCGACKLKEAKKCTNVLQVEEKGKTINYWLIDKGNEEDFHEKVCGGGELKNVTVTGVVSEKDGKKSVKTSKVEVK